MFLPPFLHSMLLLAPFLPDTADASAVGVGGSLGWVRDVCVYERNRICLHGGKGKEEERVDLILPPKSGTSNFPPKASSLRLRKFLLLLTD